ncbi:hypothetical protein COCOBI_16-3610 [Coccomyxa sp. Obi]|nr:hypothetical protein COCOBI_16-3610 [Coccomyxa sp. Obi]
MGVESMRPLAHRETAGLQGHCKNIISADRRRGDRVCIGGRLRGSRWHEPRPELRRRLTVLVRKPVPPSQDVQCASDRIPASPH